MYKHAYLILAHNNWNILNKCLELIDCDDNDIYILVDKRVRNFNKEILYTPKHSKLVHVDRINVFWADYSLIEAYQKMIYAAFDNEKREKIHYSYLHLQSGTCLPLKTQEYIHKFCDKSGKEFIGIVPKEFPYCTKRTKVYWPFINTDCFRKHKTFKAFVYAIAYLQRIFGINRLRKSDYSIINGWCNCSITHDFAEYIIDKRNLIYSMFHKTLCPDELWVHTLAYNSKFKDRLYNINDLCEGSMRYIDWHRGTPYTWGGVEDFDFQQLMKSKCLFARKFDEKVNMNIVDRICEALKEKENDNRIRFKDGY